MKTEKSKQLHSALSSSLPDGDRQDDSSQECGFVHLHVHSAFSLLEGAMPLKQILDLAKQDHQPAIAVTDRNNLFGALEFSQKAVSEGVQPIMGCKVAVDFGDGKDNQPKHGISEYPFLVFLAASEAGFENLRKLVSESHLHSDGSEHAHVKLESVQRHNAGMICLTGGKDGPLFQLSLDNRSQDVRARLSTLAEIFSDRLYVELQRHTSEDYRVENSLIPLAHDLELPLVATNQPYFAKREDFEAHDALMCIAQGTVIAVTDRHQLTQEHYFKSQNEMRELFKEIPEAIENTVEIAKRCRFREITKAPILPRFTEGDGAQSVESTVQAESDELKRQARYGLIERLKINPGVKSAFFVAPCLSSPERSRRVPFYKKLFSQLR